MIMRTKIRERSFDRQNSQTWIRYGKYAATEIFATSRSKFNVVSVVVMYASLGQHRIIFYLAFSSEQRWEI